MVKYLIALLFIQASFAQTLVNKAEQAKRERLEREEALLSQMPHIATSDLVGMDTEIKDALTAFMYTYYFHREYVVFYSKGDMGIFAAAFKFYDNPSLRGSPLFELDGDLIRVKGTNVCGLHIPKKKVFTKSWAVCDRTGCKKYISEKAVEKEVLDLNNRGFYELPSKSKICRYGSSLRGYRMDGWMGGVGWFSGSAYFENNVIVLEENGKKFYAAHNDCKVQGMNTCSKRKDERSIVENRYLESLSYEKYANKYEVVAKDCLAKNGEKCWDWFRYPIGFIPGELDNCSTDNLQPSEKELEDPDCEPFKYFEWTDKLKEEFWECLKWKPVLNFSKGKEMFCFGFNLNTDVGKPLGKVYMMRYQNISNLLPTKVDLDYSVLTGTSLIGDKEWVWSLED